MTAAAISVIVPAFNEARVLAGSLASINAAAQAFVSRGWPCELIVCDNNSTDATPLIAAAAGARVVFEPINQIARARNTGARHATGNWLIFVDADSQPPPELFAAVAREIDGGRCLAGGSTIVFDVAPLRARIGAAAWNATSRVARLAAGSFIFCDAAAFAAIGGFNEELYAAEELDLFRRLKRLARRARKRIAILHRHPLVTSSRKLHLYHWREMVPFMLRSFVRPGRTFRSADECFAWYDGRR